MKAITQIFKGIALILILTFSSCKKGDIGPAGPQGPQGNNGSAGITSTTYTVASWTWNNTAKMCYAFLPGAVLPQNVIDDGAVMVYKNIGGSSWMPLPQTLNWSPGITLHTTFQYDLNTLFLMQYFSDQSTFTPVGPDVFKVVVIPPAMIKTNVDIENYVEVKQAYNLQD